MLLSECSIIRNCLPITTPNDPPPTWPMKGKIAFSNVEMAYRKGLPLVLKDVSFEINPGEKVCLIEFAYNFFIQVAL